MSIYNLGLKIWGSLTIFSITVSTMILLSVLNFQYPIISYLGGIGLILMTIFMVYYTIINIHTKQAIKIHEISDQTPEIAIIFPIYKEDTAILKKTIQSVIQQDYPLEKIKLFIANDAHRNEVKYLVDELQADYPDVSFHHVLPPAKNSPAREGEAKGGALNATLKEINQLYPNIEYIETRDCDDCVGDPLFLKKCLTYLAKNPKIGLVQTYKDVIDLEDIDYFDTRERFLQSYTLPGKIWLNSVFSLGSGVIYRNQALLDAKGFDSWNVCEDVTTSFNIIKNGWQSQALDVVGARAQAPTTDMGNFLKQRPDWALDSLRILFFLKPNGLTLKQRLGFNTKGVKDLFFPLATLSVGLSLGLSLIIGYPLFLEIPLIAYFAIFSASIFQLLVFKGDWVFYLRHKVLEFALLFENIKMVGLAIKNGKHKKPKYIVTRKTAIHKSYLNLCYPHVLLLIFFIISITMGLFNNISGQQNLIFIVIIYWSLNLIGVIRLALYQPKRRVI